MKGENNSDEYKTIQDFKQELIDKNILHLDGVNKFDNIINKWKQTKNKKLFIKMLILKLILKNLIYI